MIDAHPSPANAGAVEVVSSGHRREATERDSATAHYTLDDRGHDANYSAVQVLMC